jgi:hypothetical protein
MELAFWKSRYPSKLLEFSKVACLAVKRESLRAGIRGSSMVSEATVEKWRTSRNEATGTYIFLDAFFLFPLTVSERFGLNTPAQRRLGDAV